ncbi:MAG: hypothetical protein H0X64_01375 [Gemmatimonadaceae bacterium]|nr:hypothetical protein [Gemmatimonadaceae bacterium]
MPTSLLRSLACLVVAALAACGDPPAPTGIDTTPVVIRSDSVRCPFTSAQQSLEVLGCGVAVRGPWTAEVAVHGARAYTTTYASSTINRGNYVNIWDVTGNTPVLVDTLAIPGEVARTSDISISDDGALMVVSTETAGTLAIYELSGPTKPRLLTLYVVPGVGSPGIHTAKFARVAGTQYVFAQATSAARGVSIIDVSVPTAPRVVGMIAAANYIHDVFVRDGRAFVADWDAGVGIWDIGGGGRGGSVTAPVLISRAATLGGNAHNVWWFHDPTVSSATTRARYLFVGEEQGGIIGVSSAGDLHVIDISDIAAPREVAIYRVDGAGAHNFWMDEARGYLYAAFYNGGVRVLDVRGDLGGCTAAQRHPVGPCDLRLMGRERAVALTGGGAYIWGVQGSGFPLADAIYASDMRHGLWKFKAVTR